MTNWQKDKLKELKEKKTEDLDANEKVLLESLDALQSAEEKVDKTEQRYDGIQKVVDDVKKELGDSRSENKKILEAIEKSGIQIPPEGKGGDDDKAKKAKLKSDADNLQKVILKAEGGKKILDDLWAAMSSEQRSKMLNDDEYRHSIYQKAKAKLNIPDNTEVKPPWAASGDDDDEGGEKDIDGIFDKIDETNHRQPPNKQTPRRKGDHQDERFDASYSDDRYVEETRTK